MPNKSIKFVRQKAARLLAESFGAHIRLKLRQILTSYIAETGQEKPGMTDSQAPKNMIEKAKQRKRRSTQLKRTPRCFAFTDQIFQFVCFPLVTSSCSRRRPLRSGTHYLTYLGSSMSPNNALHATQTTRA